MNGYVEGGYLVVIGGLASYAMSVVVRERGARRRLNVAPRDAAAELRSEEEQA